MSEKVKILMPVDFSEFTDMAFDTAENLAEVYNGELILLHVLEPPSGAMKLFSSWDEEEARKKVNKMLDDLIAKHGDRPVNFLKMVKVGKPYKAIVDAAIEIDANAIVMGTHGAAGMSEFLVGSNAAKVIRSAPHHILTLRHKPDHLGFKKILLPLDLTKETGEKVTLGIEFAKNFGSQLVIMTVLQTDDEVIKTRLQKRMDLALDFIHKHGLSAESAMIQSKDAIASVVLEYATQINADLIFIMTQQDLKFSESVIGSSAERIVNRSQIPVMSIKPKRAYSNVTFSDSHFG